MLLAKSALAWGTVPDWVAAISTTLAFAIALFLFALTVMDRRATSEERRRDQANRVAAWVDARYGKAGVDVVALKVRNASKLPIYGVVPSIDPTGNGQWIGTGDDVGVVGPGETREFEIGTTITTPFAGAPPVQLIFTDNAGHHWERIDRRGELTELSKNPFLTVQDSP